VPSIRFRLDVSDLDGVEETVRQKYGVAARVLATEEVRVGGIGGFFARRFMDVTVDIPDTPVAHYTATRKSPLDDLMERADRRDGPLAPSAVPPLSTESDAFSEVLSELSRYASPSPTGGRARPPRRRVVLLKAPGDLVVIAGIGDDALTVARALAAETPTIGIAVGGAIRVDGMPTVTNHRTAFAARARGVESGRSTIVAYGIEPGEEQLASHGAALAGIRADQLWLAVDASRKPSDTERWVNALATLVSVQAMAVLRADWTATPESVAALRLPEGWSDAVG